MALTRVADFNGGVVTTTVVNALTKAIQELQPLYATKTLDEPLFSNTTLQSDDELALVVAANSSYEVRSHIIYDSSTLADFKLGWTAPAGATLNWTGHGGVGTSITADGANFETRVLANSANVGGYGVGTQAVICPSGLLVVGSTAGTFQFQWCQVTSDAAITTVRAGSHLILRRVA